MTTMTTPPVDYVGAADVAKLVRKALKRSFPGVAFSVRSSTYSMGSSVSVRYDGIDHWDTDPASRWDTPVYKPGMPTLDAVDAVVGAYRMRAFDGSIDLGYSVMLALDADDNVIGSKSAGTAGSRGSVGAWDDTDTYASASKVARYIKGGSYISVSA